MVRMSTLLLKMIKLIRAFLIRCSWQPSRSSTSPTQICYDAIECMGLDRHRRQLQIQCKSNGPDGSNRSRLTCSSTPSPTMLQRGFTSLVSRYPTYQLKQAERSLARRRSLKLLCRETSSRPELGNQTAPSYSQWTTQFPRAIFFTSAWRSQGPSQSVAMFTLPLTNRDILQNSPDGQGAIQTINLSLYATRTNQSVPEGTATQTQLGRIQAGR